MLRCRDTPGFLANRIGNFWMAVAASEALRGGVGIETADAVMTRHFGTPRTGVFGLFDLVGINLVPLIWTSFLRLLPADDAYHRFDITTDPTFTGLLERGLVGRRGPGGFTRRQKTPDGPVDEVLDGVESGQITEVFACGTAAVVTPIVGFNSPQRGVAVVGDGQPGPKTEEIRRHLVDVQFGRAEDAFGWTRKVC